MFSYRKYKISIQQPNNTFERKIRKNKRQPLSNVNNPPVVPVISAIYVSIFTGCYIIQISHINHLKCFGCFVLILLCVLEYIFFLSYIGVVMSQTARYSTHFYNTFKTIYQNVQIMKP